MTVEPLRVYGMKEKTDKDPSADGKENLVRLKFDGEEEAEREMSVERRYVLPRSGG